jgi:membrane-associated protein
MLLAFFQGLIDLLTGSLWTYPLLFGICVGDALVPAFPSETAVIVCGIQAARGELSLEWVIAWAAAGAFIGDNAS